MSKILKAAATLARGSWSHDEFGGMDCDDVRALAMECRQEYDEFKSMAEQFCVDLNQAHDELMIAQGITPEEAKQHDWPEWTPQANSIRWAEKILKRRLAKTTAWTLYPNPRPSARLTGCPECDGPCKGHAADQEADHD